VGGGVAAINAIKAIREYNSEAYILLFQNENYYPYYRIRLTKSLFENLDIDKILLQKKEWYEANNVQMHLGAEISAVDVTNNQITLSDGQTFHYDQLLLANGASNFKPPIEGIDHDGVFSIRKYDDIQHIKANSDGKDTVVCIGGGIQNLEAAWALSSQGKKVIIAEFQDKLMPRQLDSKASALLKKSVEDLSLQVLLNTQITKIMGKDGVTGVLTKEDKQFDCDMILYSVGIRPNIKIYENTPLKINQGVIIDDRMRTNISNIYAAGDIAKFHDRVGGLWTIAAEQGKIAGYNIAGNEAIYTVGLPVTTMNAFNLSIFSVGNVNEEGCSQTITDDNSEQKSYKRLFIQNNKIIGAINIGDNKFNTLLKNLVISQVELPEIDLSKISVVDLLDQLKTN
jgi:nitrite reductase (NADH) large subunit